MLMRHESCPLEKAVRTRKVFEFSIASLFHLHRFRNKPFLCWLVVIFGQFPATTVVLATKPLGIFSKLFYLEEKNVLVRHLEREQSRK